MLVVLYFVMRVVCCSGVNSGGAVGKREAAMEDVVWAECAECVELRRSVSSKESVDATEGMLIMRGT